MKYTHIKDCWSKVKAATTIEELEDLFDEFPRWSGDWEIRLEDDHYLVVNTYYDKQLCEWFTDEEQIDINVEDEE